MMERLDYRMVRLGYRMVRLGYRKVRLGLRELNHPPALLATPPPFILCKAMQSDISSISFLQGETLILFTAH